LAPDLLSHYEHAKGDYVEIGELPDLFLQLDALLEFVDPGTFTYEEMIRCGGHSVH
jgi:hypothetical protein